MHMAIEEHGAGKQLVRLRSWPRLMPFGLVMSLVAMALSILAFWAAVDQAWIPAAIMGLVAAMLAPRVFADCAAAKASVLLALKQVDRGEG
jgi:hypothetical protein